MFTKNGGDNIQKQIDNALKKGANQIIVTGDYEIEKAIILPENFTIILQDAHLRLADDTNCNIFINRSSVQPIRTTEQTDHNINIIGVGRAILDGANLTGLTNEMLKRRVFR